MRSTSPVFRADPSRWSTAQSPPPTVSDEPQGLDKNCSFDCDVTSPNSVICGHGTILCTKGYSEGKHYWEFTANQCGWYAFCGVATRDPGDDAEVLRGYPLSGMEAGYAICGWTSPGTSPAFHAGIETQTKLPFFVPGDSVGLLLDCDEGSLVYFLNRKKIGSVFDGMLHSRTLYPAFGGGSLTTEFTNITWDLPLPSS